MAEGLLTRRVIISSQIWTPPEVSLRPKRGVLRREKAGEGAEGSWPRVSQPRTIPRRSEERFMVVNRYHATMSQDPLSSNSCSIWPQVHPRSVRASRAVSERERERSSPLLGKSQSQKLPLPVWHSSHSLSGEEEASLLSKKVIGEWAG